MRKREVGAPVLLNFFHLLLFAKLIDHLLAEVEGVLFGQIFVRNRQQLAVHTEFRRHERADMKVTAAFVDCSLKKILNMYVHSVLGFRN